VQNASYLVFQWLEYQKAGRILAEIAQCWDAE